MLEKLVSSGFLRRLPAAKDQVSDQRNSFFVDRKYESKNNRDLDDLTKYDPWNMGSIVCNCMSTQKSATIKAIVVNFLNLFDGNSCSVVFLCDEMRFLLRDENTAVEPRCIRISCHQMFTEPT